MRTSLRKLIKDLQQLVESDPTIGDLPVYSMHSASGCSDEFNGFCVQTIEDSNFCEAGPVARLHPGDRYIEVSVGGN